MADITATATLDAQQFTRELQRSLREAQRWRNEVQRTLSFDPLASVHASVQQLRAGIRGVGKLNITVNAQPATTALNQTTQAAKGTTRQMTALQQQVEEYRNKTLGLRNAVESGLVTQQQGIRFAKQFRDEALQAAKGAQMWSKEWRELMVAAGRADRTLATLEGRVTKLGLSQNVAIANTHSLAGAYQQLSGAVAAVFATAGIARYTRSLIEFGREGAAATNTLTVFYMQLEKSGIPAERGAARIRMLAQEFRTTEDVVASGVTQLIRYGATLDQAVHILRRGGASALAAGHTAARGFEAVTQAIVGEMSAALNRIGIAGNLSTAYQRLARDLGTTADQLTAQQKIQAVVNDLLRETDTEYEALGVTLSGFVGRLNDGETAWSRFRRSLGRGGETFLAPLIGGATLLMNVFTALPEPIQRVLTVTSLLGIAVAGVAVAYSTLKTVLGRVAIVQTLVNALVASETKERTRLGGMLLVLAGRYKLLTREQIVNTVASRDAVRGVTLWGTALQAVKTGATKAIAAVRGLTTASLRFVATPVGAVLTAIAGAFLLINSAVRRNQAIVKPAMDALSTAADKAAVSARGLWNRLIELTGVGETLARAWRATLIVIARAVAVTMARVAASVQTLAATFTLLEEVTSIGPRRAWANYRATLQQVKEDTDALIAEVNRVTQGVRDGTIAASGLSDELDLTGEEAEDAAEKLAKLREEAEKLQRTFSQRLQDIRIGLIADDELRELEQARVSFQRLRDEIREAAEENVEFAPFADMLIAQSFELEQQELLRIQQEYADERRDQAIKQARELADAVRERERAIIDAQTRGQLTRVGELQLEHKRRVEDTERLYADLIAKAREYGADTTGLERLRAAEILALNEAHARDVTAVYDELYRELGDKQAELVRQAADARGDQRAVLGFDFQKELRDLDEFYSERRRLAAGNEDLLTAIAETETQARLQAHRRYFDAVMALTEERGAALLEREQGLAQARAALDGDDVATLRLQHAAQLREIHRAYDALERAAAGNADELARIANLRNQEVALANEKLAKDLEDLADAEAAAAFAPMLEGLTSGLEDASAETLDSLQLQLRQWRVVYGGNGEVVKAIDAALEQVGKRHQALAEETRKATESLIEDVQALTTDIAVDDAGRGLSDLEQRLFEAAQQTQRLHREQERVLAALATATGEQREELIAASHDVAAALDTVHRNVLQDAERIVTDAIDAYQRGLEDARADASRAAVDLVTSDIETVIGRISGVQTAALQEARTRLLRTIASLSVAGVDQAALAPLRQQVLELDAVLARTARSTADFAADQHRALRELAASVLDEAAAQRVAHATYRETIRLRQAALAEARREGASLDELATLTRAVTDAQVEYMASLQGQVSDLRGLRGEYHGVFQAASDLAELLDQPVPTTVIRSQEQLATAALESVRAAQEAGQSFAEYGDSLTTAVGLWRDFQSASEQSIRATADTLKRDLDLSGAFLPDQADVGRLAARIADLYEVTGEEAVERLNRFFRGQVVDPLAGLVIRQPDVLADILAGLNTEAAQTPGVIAGIDAQIAALEQQVTDLKATIAEAVDFGAAGQQLVSGYRDVLEAVADETMVTFDEAAVQAVNAFNTRFATESTRLREELEAQLGPVVEAAGLSAGAGLMTAFASGVTANRQVLLDAVEDVLQDVRSRLPSSDAKRGPLSDLTHSGRMLVRTFLSGAQRERQRLATGMNRLLATARPSAAFMAASAAYSAMPAAGMGPVTVNVDGTRSVTPGTLALNARALVRDVERELKLRGR